METGSLSAITSCKYALIFWHLWITSPAPATRSFLLLSLRPSRRLMPCSARRGLLPGVQPLADSLPGTAWPLTFLAGQIVESALKAYLAKHGLPEEDLKRLGHDLMALWARAVMLGLSVFGGHPVWFVRLSELHSDPHLIRYPMKLNGLVLPQCVEMARDLPLLVEAVK